MFKLKAGEVIHILPPIEGRYSAGMRLHNFMQALRFSFSDATIDDVDGDNTDVSALCAVDVPGRPWFIPRTLDVMCANLYFWVLFPETIRHERLKADFMPDFDLE